jgi:hypothetical protein
MYSNMKDSRAPRRRGHALFDVLLAPLDFHDYNGYNGASNAFAVLNPPASQ